MKRPTRDLGDEHSGIAIMLQILDKMSDRLIKNENIERSHLEKVVEFLRIFADKCHHGKEENILFPRIANDKSNTALINELLGEHKTGRDYIRGIAESVENFQPGNSDAFHIAGNMKCYIALLKDHIRKENEILFPAADNLLSDAEQAEIEKEFEELERELIGAGKHEEYHRWLQELGNYYNIDS